MFDFSTSRIEIQSFDLYNRIEQIHRQPAAAPENLRAKYILLYKVLEQACYELTVGVTFSFANLFSRIDYICKEKRMTPSDRYAIQTMRRNCNAAMRNDFQPLMEEYLYDLRALVRFISLAFEEDIPASLLRRDRTVLIKVRSTRVFPTYELRLQVGTRTTSLLRPTVKKTLSSSSTI